MNKPTKRSPARLRAAKLPAAPHPLAVWLRATGTSQAVFAAEIGVARTTLNKILNGRTPRRFTVEAARRVVNATLGRVTLADCFYHWTDNEPPARRGE